MLRSIFNIRIDTWPDKYGNQARDDAVERITEAIDTCTFPWWRCIPALRRNDRFPFPIEFMDPLDGASGYVSRNRMWLRPSADGMPTAQTIAHELAHVADLATLGEGTWQDGPVFNSTRSPWRDELLRIASHHDTDDHHGDSGDLHNWQTNQFQNWPWQVRPIENITVPFAKAFWDDEKHHYTGHWLNRIKAEGHTWDDVERVRDIFLSRSIKVFEDDDEISEAHREAVHHLAALGILRGDREGNVRPKEFISVERMSSMLSRAINLTSNGE